MIWGRLFLTWVALVSAIASADDFSDVALGVHSSIGYQGEYYSCPCLRWKVDVKLLDGRIETHEIIISTDALLAIEESYLTKFKENPDEIFRIGAVEALSKNYHVGIGFDGLSLGAERDKNVTDLIRSGVYGLVSIIRNSALRLDLRTGYEFESFIVYGEQHTRHRLSETLRFNWRGWRFSGEIQARVSDDANTGGFNPSYYVATKTQFRAVSIKNVSLSPGIQASIENDPFRELYGLVSKTAVAGVYVDVSYAPLGKGNW